MFFNPFALLRPEPVEVMFFNPFALSLSKGKD
jgi:hypothetical protein